MQDLSSPSDAGELNEQSPDHGSPSNNTGFTRRTLLGSVTAMAAGAAIEAMSGGRLLAQAAHLQDRRNVASGLVADRWLELDLYWFRQPNLEESARQFWKRYLPLYAGLEGYRGVILSVAWTVGPVMEWSGDLSQKVSVPTGTGDSLEQPVDGWVPETAPLNGTTEEQKRQWHARFAPGKAAGTKRRPSDRWTYGDLKNLANLLRSEAERNGVSDFKVGMFTTGGEGAYGEHAPWAYRHPEAFSPRFNPDAPLHADPRHLGGLPDGISAGMLMRDAYAAQWGSLSKAVGFDAILLRDMIGLPTVYKRGGPWGPVAPSPELITQATAGVAALVRETKLANPNALVMMYSNGASAIADWRSNGLDLESVAREGYLDIFIDQSWSGSWNEVGVRRKSFWNSPVQGWTYQLGYILLHAAILADTKVRHYPLVETFDAWEDWDVLHSVPEKLRWAIWAYSHAALKTPNGLRLPAGSYISWGNRGDDLLSTNDVDFLAGNLNSALANARQTTEVSGPTLVYSRKAMAWQASHARPDFDIKEWIDEQAATVIKWPVPVLSVTRVEWLPEVKSDLFIIQTPSHLAPEDTAYIEKLIEQGQPLAIFGDPAHGVDPKLAALAGLVVRGEAENGPIGKYPAATGSDTLKVLNAPATFESVYRLAPTQTSDGAQTVYSVDGDPELTLNLSRGKRVAMWDPPELLARISSKSPLVQIVKSGDSGPVMVRLDGQLDLPLKQIWGNRGTPYALVAGVLNSLLHGAGALHVTAIDLMQTVSLTAWKTADGSTWVLAANLEEGIRDDADLSRHTSVVLPSSSMEARWIDVWGHKVIQPRRDTLPIDLAQATSILLQGRGGRRAQADLGRVAVSGSALD